jgi:hypothetical protein
MPLFTYKAPPFGRQLLAQLGGVPDIVAATLGLEVGSDLHESVYRG